MEAEQKVIKAEQKEWKTRYGVIKQDDLFNFVKPINGERYQTMGIGLKENCLVSAAFQGTVGGIAGMAFGMFFGSMSASHNWTPEMQNMTMKESLKQQWAQTKASSVSMGKQFGMLGAVYNLCECMYEKQTGKHEVSNAGVAGCMAGALLGVSGGPGTMTIGCAGFGAFSLAIESYMHS